MCEVILLFVLGKQLASKARAKGHAPAGYVILLVVGWIIGEVGGLIIGGILSYVANPNTDDPNMAIVLICAVAGIAVAVIGSFTLVSLLPDRSRHDDYDDYRYGPDNRRRPERDDWEEKWNKGGGRRETEDPWEREDRFEK